ncbi:MAG: signal recognition particle protein Srp19 [Thermoplasmata archaeon]|nr:MAG: signal recognition particle protein Srp19 [Thermoplasmata archaeon]RLF34318.1 MAG: signal recognition particle protein Srp19 [Thermoplasmata archaeon]RLF39584.1 MAG: signal recognition particle protein Srp19 [Thermoplasmata archaeon]HDN50458.1 signal recognition particle protein Srp19 [Thermoplasmatales archaeon]
MRDKWVIWPIYIDATASRKQGRKISRERAVKNPTADDIVKAAKKLGLNPVKEEKSYPKRWWRREGRVLVDKKERKMSILVKIAENVKQSKLNI